MRRGLIAARGPLGLRQLTFERLAPTFNIDAPLVFRMKDALVPHALKRIWPFALTVRIICKRFT